jgi:amidohydrolase
MLLGAARYLAQHREFDGTIYLIFQPAEEGGGGAREMIADGLFERFPMEVVYAIHNWPGAPVGALAVSPGPVMASSNEFEITIVGKGAHAAMPHLGLDPVPVACQLVQAFQTIVSRNANPNDAAVISVTQINAGETTNVIPNTCTLAGTVRTFSLDVLDMVEARMRELSEHITAAFAMGVQFEFVRNYPPTINHEQPVAFVRQALADVLKPEHLIDQVPTMGAEDFSYMLQARPGAYMFLGNGQGDHRAMGHGAGPCTLHNPSYDFNDDLLPVGASIWVTLAQRWLNRD